MGCTGEKTYEEAVQFEIRRYLNKFLNKKFKYLLSKLKINYLFNGGRNSK